MLLIPLMESEQSRTDMDILLASALLADTLMAGSRSFNLYHGYHILDLTTDPH